MTPTKLLIGPVLVAADILHRKSLPAVQFAR